jgi:HPt (histidine-containing phosphotransfer) domain-containing protein
MRYQYISPEKIKELLFNESEFVAEFCEAGLQTLGEFQEQYRTHVLDRNMNALRKAGHKMKPGASMMGADIIVHEYENVKELLKQDADLKKLQSSVEQMEKLCEAISEELNTLRKNSE